MTDYAVPTQWLGRLLLGFVFILIKFSLFSSRHQIISQSITLRHIRTQLETLIETSCDSIAGFEQYKSDASRGILLSWSYVRRHE